MDENTTESNEPHEHDFRHLATWCSEESGRASFLWKRTDEFYCKTCLEVQHRVLQSEYSFPPPWWIAKGEKR